MSYSGWEEEGEGEGGVGLSTTGLGVNEGCCCCLDDLLRLLMTLCECGDRGGNGGKREHLSNLDGAREKQLTVF